MHENDQPDLLDRLGAPSPVAAGDPPIPQIPVPEPELPMRKRGRPLGSVTKSPANAIDGPAGLVEIPQGVNPADFARMVAAAQQPPQTGLRLGARICKVMEEIERLGKDGHNTHDKYRYVTEGAIVDHVRPLMAKHGVVVYQDAELETVFRAIETTATVNNKPVTKVVHYVEVHYNYRIENADDPNDFRMMGSKGSAMLSSSRDKWPYVCSTGAHKYLLLRLFNISSGDADPENPEFNKPDREERQPAPAAPAGRPAAQQPTPQAPPRAADAAGLTSSAPTPEAQGLSDELSKAILAVKTAQDYENVAASTRLQFRRLRVLWPARFNELSDVMLATKETVYAVEGEPEFESNLK